MHGVLSNYADPSSAGVPREDGDWIGEKYFEITEWVLGYLGLEEPTGFILPRDFKSSRSDVVKAAILYFKQLSEIEKIEGLRKVCSTRDSTNEVKF